tara:strand:+ start:87296 stop:88120 length:825 start_codon:yes stop_codon:yes gene_type:complete
MKYLLLLLLTVTSVFGQKAMRPADYESIYNYPVFKLEVPFGSDFTDFELKASTSNFLATETDATSTATFIHSDDVAIMSRYIRESATVWRSGYDPTYSLEYSGTQWEFIFDSSVVVITNPSDETYPWDIAGTWTITTAGTNTYGLTDNTLNPQIDDGKMVFYFHSPGDTGFGIGDDPSVWFTWSANAVGDSRSWVPKTTSNSIYSLSVETDLNSEIGAIIIVVTDPTILSLSRDETLIWSYLWFSPDDFDKDIGNRPIWRSITPTEWVSKDFNP